MAKRKCKISLAPVTAADRRPRIAVDVPNPYDARVMDRVIRYSDRSPLHHVFDRGWLRGKGETQDDAEARKIAGERLAAIHKRSEIGQSKGFDPSKVKVDVSFAYSGIPDNCYNALAEKNKIRFALGKMWVILDFLVIQEIPSMRCAEILANRRIGGTDTLKFYSDLRAALDALIDHFGVATGRGSGRILSTGEKWVPAV